MQNNKQKKPVRTIKNNKNLKKTSDLQILVKGFKHLGKNVDIYISVWEHQLFGEQEQ